MVGTSVRRAMIAALAMLILGGASAHAQITWELAETEPEYPFLGSYDLTRNGETLCEVTLTDKMRFFEGFRVEHSGCPAPFDKAQAWLLKPGKTIEILGRWDHPVWSGSDPDADSTFTGVATDGETYALAGKGQTLNQGRAETQDFLDPWEGIYTLQLVRRQGPVCQFALLNMEARGYLKAAVVERGCLRDFPRMAALLETAYWSTPGTLTTLYLKTRADQVIVAFSAFSGNRYRGQMPEFKGRVHTAEIEKVRELTSEAPPLEEMFGLYNFSPADRDALCEIGLTRNEVTRGYRVEAVTFDCFASMEIESWALVEDRLVFYSPFGEQTFTAREVFPGLWAGVDQNGLTVTLEKYGR